MKRVGVVGMGKMGIVHSSILNALPDVELAAVMDKDRGRRRYLSGMGIRTPFYHSLEEMLEIEELDSVFVCVPSSSSYVVAKSCVERGISIFVEKPLADNLATANKMMALIKDKKDVKHAVGFMTAYVSTFHKAKQILRSGSIGEVREIRTSAYQSAVFSKQKLWFYKKGAADGGAIISLGSYLIFLLHWLFSPVRQVRKVSLTYSSGNEVEDIGKVEMELASGIRATMDISWSAPGYDNMELEILVVGSRGELRVTNHEIELQLKEQGVTRIHVSELPDRAKFYLGGEGYYLEDEDFTSCLGTDKEPKVTWREGYQVQVVLDAIYRSAEANQATTLQGKTIWK